MPVIKQKEAYHKETCFPWSQAWLLFPSIGLLYKKEKQCQTNKQKKKKHI